MKKAIPTFIEERKNLPFTLERGTLCQNGIKLIRISQLPPLSQMKEMGYIINQ